MRNAHGDDGLANVLGNQPGACQIRLGQHDGKLFATMTGCNIARTTDIGLKRAGDRAEDLVALPMAVAIVEVLEVIGVDIQQRQSRAGTNIDDLLRVRTRFAQSLVVSVTIPRLREPGAFRF